MFSVRISLRRVITNLNEGQLLSLSKINKDIDDTCNLLSAKVFCSYVYLTKAN